MSSLPERFWAKVDKDAETDCWNWRGEQSYNGYGRWRPTAGASRRRTHRLVYEALVGPIGTGLHLDHLCRNPLCCNPAHLEPVTPAENVRRSVAARRALGLIGPQTNHRAPVNPRPECRQGHRLEGEGVYIKPDGRRQCNVCRIATSREYRRRQRNSQAA